MRVVLATTSGHKVREIRRLLEGYDVELIDRPTHVDDVEETAETLEGNALIKARALRDATGEAALADDTGLFVDGLGGRPGVRSARYAGALATDESNVAKLLAELSAAKAPTRHATFRTVVAVALPGGDEWWVAGTLAGEILAQPRGAGGFGYDAIFAPSGLGGRSLAELTMAEKNDISHRGVALRRVAQTLASS